MVIGPAPIAQITNLKSHIFVDLRTALVRSVLFDRLLHRARIHYLEAQHGDTHLLTKLFVFLRLRLPFSHRGLDPEFLALLELASVSQEMNQYFFLLLVRLNIVHV